MRDVTDWNKVNSAIAQIYDAVSTLENEFEGRKFTPDGHLVGSIGEVLAAYAFDLKLQNGSNKGFDATASDGRQIEIKLTQSTRVAFRHLPEHALVLSRRPNQKTRIIYNGPGELVWSNCGPMGSNGQRSVSIARLTELSALVPDERALLQFRDFPV